MPVPEFNEIKAPALEFFLDGKPHKTSEIFKTLGERFELTEQDLSEVLPSAMFRVSLDNGHTVLATIGGNLRRFRIRVLAGDRVTLEVSPYDLTRGRIVYRHR